MATKKTLQKGGKSKSDLTVSEAGRLGGNKVKQEYGPDFYAQIGTKGGEAVRDAVDSGELPKDFYSKIGKKGGNKVAKAYGPEFYSQIGKKGGNKVKEEYGPDFYSQIGHKGGQKVKELIERAKKG